MPCWKLADRELVSDKPLVMGILNLTPDSFSDGGRFASPEQAIAAALAMQADGADILDIGGQSTRPGHTPLSAEEEWARLAPVLPTLRQRLRLPLSIDTYHPTVAERATALGVAIINDVSGSLQNGMTAVAAASGAGLVMTCPEAACVADVAAYFRAALDRAEADGMDRRQVCLDVGIGFGKTRELDRELIMQLPLLRREFAEQCLLVGASRKRVIAAFGGDAPPDKRLGGTLAAHTLAQLGGADVLRVHDVLETVQAVTLTAAFSERSK